MKYLGKFESREEAEKCAEEKDGFVKKQSYEVNGSGKKDKLTYWYVYPNKEIDEIKKADGDKEWL